MSAKRLASPHISIPVWAIQFVAIPVGSATSKLFRGFKELQSYLLFRGIQIILGIALLVVVFMLCLLMISEVKYVHSKRRLVRDHHGNGDQVHESYTETRARNSGTRTREA